MDKQFEHFITELVRPEYRAVAEAFIALVETTVPELRPGMRGGTEKYISVPVWRLARDVIVMSPSQRGLTISFAKGAQFEDAARLLGGKGKNSRTLLLRRTDDVQRPEMISFLRQAVALNG